MSPEIREAIESAGSAGAPDRVGLMRPYRRMSADRVRAVVLAVVRELPSEMTLAELRDELEIANNQV